jgi:hypothetical protein
MANTIETYNIIDSRNFTVRSSRYLNSRIYYYGGDKKITYETYKRKTYAYSDSDKFYEINPGLNYRPDLVSNNFYGVPDYWWLIMEYNGIYDIFDFTSGKIIRLPPVTEIT